MQRKVLVGIIVALVVAAGATGGYIFSTSYGGVRGFSSCPPTIALASFQDASGFVAVVHPQAGITEFVLAPNTSGNVTVSYSSAYNILTNSMFVGGSVPVWYVDTSNGSVQGISTNIHVVPVSTQGNGTHTMLVKYTISAGSSEGLYLISLPGTCRSVWVNVGASAYRGPAPWSSRPTFLVGMPLLFVRTHRQNIFRGGGRRGAAHQIPGYALTNLFLSRNHSMLLSSLFIPRTHALLHFASKPYPLLFFDSAQFEQSAFNFSFQILFRYKPDYFSICHIDGQCGLNRLPLRIEPAINNDDKSQVSFSVRINLPIPCCILRIINLNGLDVLQELQDSGS